MNVNRLSSWLKDRHSDWIKRNKTRFNNMQPTEDTSKQKDRKVKSKRMEKDVIRQLWTKIKLRSNVNTNKKDFKSKDLRDKGQ